jgi:hypothetical protein
LVDIVIKLDTEKAWTDRILSSLLRPGKRIQQMLAEKRRNKDLSFYA